MKHNIPLRRAGWTPLAKGATVLAVVAATVLAAGATYAQGTPKRGGTLTIGTEVDPPSVDPLRLGSYVDRQFGLAIFDTLLEVDTEGKIVPGLASGYEVSTDGKKYTLKLRKGVKFHDGTPFNADAVVYNFERSRNPANACRCLANLAPVSAVNKADEHTVEILLKAPYASFPAILADTPGMMVSPAAVQANPTGFGNQPVGTGPFKLVQWTKGSRFIADRNPDYWKEGKPYVDRLVYRGLQNAETREATMVSGALDILTQPPPKFTLRAKTDKQYVVLEPAGFGSLFVAFHSKHPALGDVRVRRAIAHATDRPLVLKAIYQDLIKLATTPFGYGIPGLEQVKDYPSYDPEKAKALLKEFGKPVKFSIIADNTPVTQQVIQVLQQMWQKVGIEVELKPLDQVRLVHNMLVHDFEASLFRWSGRPDPDLNVYGFFHSSNAEKQTSSNYGQYKLPELDTLLDAGRQTTDYAKRVPIYNQVSELLARELPYLFLGYVSAPIVTTTKVHGVPKVPDSLVRVDEVWKD